MVVVIAGHAGGTRGSVMASSAADVLGMSVLCGMSVLRGMREVGGGCEMCMYFARGGVVGEGDSG